METSRTSFTREKWSCFHIARERMHKETRTVLRRSVMRLQGSGNVIVLLDTHVHRHVFVLDHRSSLTRQRLHFAMQDTPST